MIIFRWNMEGVLIKSEYRMITTLLGKKESMILLLNDDYLETTKLDEKV